MNTQFVAVICFLGAAIQDVKSHCSCYSPHQSTVYNHHPQVLTQQVYQAPHQYVQVEQRYQSPPKYFQPDTIQTNNVPASHQYVQYAQQVTEQTPQVVEIPQVAEKQPQISQEQPELVQVQQQQLQEIVYSQPEVLQAQPLVQEAIIPLKAQQETYEINHIVQNVPQPQIVVQQVHQEQTATESVGNVVPSQPQSFQVEPAATAQLATGPDSYRSNIENTYSPTNPTTSYVEETGGSNHEAPHNYHQTVSYNQAVPQCEQYVGSPIQYSWQSPVSYEAVAPQGYSYVASPNHQCH